MDKNWFPLITNNMFVDNDSKETVWTKLQKIYRELSVTKRAAKSYAHYGALVTHLNAPFSTNMRMVHEFPNHWCSTCVTFQIRFKSGLKKINHNIKRLWRKTSKQFVLEWISSWNWSRNYLCSFFFYFGQFRFIWNIE
jgi:hypothetical protein